MELNEIIEKIKSKVEKLFENDKTGHDINHLKRTLKIELKIQEQEGGNKIVIGVSAFLHDIHRLMSKDQNRFVHPKESLDTIKDILLEINLDQNIITHILHCIEFHEEYSFSEKGITVNDIETLILQDADNLDAIGAIGIARTGMYCGNYNIPMWRTEASSERKYYEETQEDVSMIHHFYSKLLKLKDNMNTKTGKKLALARHRFMRAYLNEFFLEWNGEK